MRPPWSKLACPQQLLLLSPAALPALLRASDPLSQQGSPVSRMESGFHRDVSPSSHNGSLHLPPVPRPQAFPLLLALCHRPGHSLATTPM